MKRKSRKGVKITPHKGGRTVSKRTDVTPETNEMLKALKKAHKISLADIVEEAVKKKFEEMQDGGT